MTTIALCASGVGNSDTDYTSMRPDMDGVCTCVGDEDAAARRHELSRRPWPEGFACTQQAASTQLRAYSMLAAVVSAR